jgi:hypothetical protein
MAQLMRVVLSLSALFVANGDSDAKCALTGLGAVDDLLDAAIYVWAATERCGSPGEVVRCEVDVASAAESVQGVVNVMLKALDKCDVAHHVDCSRASLDLTTGVAGLAAASGGIIANCPNKFQPSETETARSELREVKADIATEKKGDFTRKGHCIVDVKHSLKAIFKTIKVLMSLKKDRSKNAIKVVAAFAGLGEYLAGIVGHCTDFAHVDALCAGQSARLLKELTNVAKGGRNVAKECHTSESRLYALDNDDETEIAEDSSSSSVTLALAAMLPLAAVVGFVSGTRLSKGHSQRSTREIQPLVAEE